VAKIVMDSNIATPEMINDEKLMKSSFEGILDL